MHYCVRGEAFMADTIVLTCTPALVLPGLHSLIDVCMDRGEDKLESPSSMSPLAHNAALASGPKSAGAHVRQLPTIRCPKTTCSAYLSLSTCEAWKLVETGILLCPVPLISLDDRTLKQGVVFLTDRYRPGMHFDLPRLLTNA